MNPRVTEIRATIAPAASQADGLLAWVRFRVEPFQFDSVALRRTASGRLALSFPTRRDAGGREHAFVYPTDPDTRRAIEAQVIDALAKDGRLSA